MTEIEYTGPPNSAALYQYPTQHQPGTMPSARKETGKMTHPTCEQRIQVHLESCIEDLQTLYALYCEDSEEYHEDLGNLDEFGLCFDYVEPGTFTDQREGYWRYQLSYGGPSDEFRFYVTPGRHGLEPHCIEYWFLDWYDGAYRTLDLKSADGQLLLNIWGFFEPTWAEYEMAQ